MIARRALSVLLMATVMVVIPGCGSTADDPGDAYLGTWKTNEGWYLEFNADGTFAMGGSVERIASDPLEWGTFAFDGATLRLETADDSTYCTGIVAVYQSTPADDGDSIEQSAVDDACGARRSDLSSGITRYP
ncbi:MAG: hypothetical protein HKN93_03795 [Acidimicrobiia bacterium]|nr:hypothetical protein [Acidimicrobiia bacterium]